VDKRRLIHAVIEAHSDGMVAVDQGGFIEDRAMDGLAQQQRLSTALEGGGAVGRSLVLDPTVTEVGDACRGVLGPVTLNM
jgi:hypothetical protein